MCHHVTYFILFSQVIIITLTLHNPVSAQLRKCTDFRDLRNDPTNFLAIPANLSSHGEKDDRPLYFDLKNVPPSAWNFNLNCEPSSMYLQTLSFSTSGLMQDPPSKHLPNLSDNTTSWLRNYANFVSSSDIPLPVHFTPDGSFFAGEHFYNSSAGEFCVKTVQEEPEESIELRICQADCRKPPKYPNDALCLPKCCGLDEVLLYWRGKCVKLDTLAGEIPWRPRVTQGHNRRIRFYQNFLPKTCNQDVGLGFPFVASWNSVELTHPKQGNTDPKNEIKFGTDSKQSSMIYPMLLFTRNRTWKLEKNIPFCADGLFMKPKGSQELYKGDPDRFVVYHCGAKVFNDDGSRMGQSVVYVAISIVASLFLLATVVVYVLLLDKQSLHGLTILSYSIAQFGSYVSLIIAHIIFLFPNPDFTGILRRGWFCYIIAITAHYFYLSSYVWMTLMNFDLWVTFSSLRMVKKNPKDSRRFALYSLASWGLPAILVGVFIAIDEIYRDPTTLVPVPDYATSTCFVSPDFRGEYVYLPMSIFFAVNFLLILVTMRVFILARKQSKTAFGGEGDASNAGKYSAILFIKLFILMGGTSIIDFLTWYYNQDDKPWIIVFLECIAYLVPVMLFILLCLNRRILKQMREKYPKLTRITNTLLTFRRQSQQPTSSGLGDHDHSGASNKTGSTVCGGTEEKESVALVHNNETELKKFATGFGQGKYGASN